MKKLAATLGIAIALAALIGVMCWGGYNAHWYANAVILEPAAAANMAEDAMLEKGLDNWRLESASTDGSRGRHWFIYLDGSGQRIDIGIERVDGELTLTRFSESDNAIWHDRKARASR